MILSPSPPACVKTGGDGITIDFLHEPMVKRALPLVLKSDTRVACGTGGDMALLIANFVVVLKKEVSWIK